MERDPLMIVYEDLCPGIEKIYVIPNIDKFSRHNIYLKLFYGDLLEGRQPHLQFLSSSLMNPSIVLRRFTGERSLLHHHWFEIQTPAALLNALWKIGWGMLYKSLGGKIVWTIHNKTPHGTHYKRLNQLIRRVWSRIPHKIHVHCAAAAEIMASHLGIPRNKFFIIPHPPYPVRRIDQKEARRLLVQQYKLNSIDDNSLLFLMFGYIAEYKGIREVITLFKTMLPSHTLLVAGAVKKGSQAYFQDLLKLVKQTENVLLLNRYIASEDVHLFFNAADHVIFNYRDILESGGVILARCYGKSVIVPDIGCLGELRGEGVHHFEDRQALGEVLKQLVKSSRVAESG